MSSNESRIPEVISIKNLWAGYNGQPVLEDINLSIHERDFIGLIGPNGAGKTTLFRAILGLLKPSHGEVKVLNKSPEEARHEIGYVPQAVDFDHEFPISVKEVVTMGRLGARGILKRLLSSDSEMVENALKKLELLDLRNRPIGELSVGQRRRVYIARALAAEPKILLLDEPTDSVDPHIYNKVFELLRELNKKITILMISHDLSVISSYVKTIGCLNRKLYYHGGDLTPEILEQVYQCPVDVIAHGAVPHRVLNKHNDSEHAH